MFIVRDSNTRTKIDSFEELENAKFVINMFEHVDKLDGIYEPNFYEIYDSEKEEIVE